MPTAPKAMADDLDQDVMVDDEERNEEENWKDDDFLGFGNNGEEEEEDNDAEQDDGDLHEEAAMSNGVLVHSDGPPWMSAAMSKTAYNRYQVLPMIRLHNEIVGFCKLMEPRKQEVEAREEMLKKFKALAKRTFEQCEVKVFGSQATGLFLPTSDIDVVILLPENDETSQYGSSGDHKRNNQEPSEAETRRQEQEEMERWNLNSHQSPLHRLADALFTHWKDALTYLEVIENTRVPLVKFTVMTGDDVDSELSFDICLDQETGPKAAALMKTYLQAMPPLRPLTFVLKYFLASRGLNEPYSGGIGSYLLQLMIVSFLQHRARDGYNFRRPAPYNLGCLLVEFLELYGLDLNYFTTGISVRYDGYYFPKGSHQHKEHFVTPGRTFLLAVENPLEPTMDVGKSSFKIQTIQRSMELAFKVLLAHVTEPRIEAVSILASILPPTPEMTRRQQNQQRQQQILDVDSPDEVQVVDGGQNQGQNARRKRARLE